MKKLGDGNSTADFDLKSAGIDEARYLRFEVPSGSVQLDAIEAKGSSMTVVDQNCE